MLPDALFAKWSHPVMVPADMTLRWHWLSGYSVGFQVALHDAVSIRDAQAPVAGPAHPARPKKSQR